MRYSDYTVEQLCDELGKLKEESQRAEQLGELHKLLVLERKMQMVAAYLLHPDDFKPNETYKLKGDPGNTFKISYLDGVMAWGRRIDLGGSEEKMDTAIPISLLGDRLA